METEFLVLIAQGVSKWSAELQVDMEPDSRKRPPCDTKSTNAAPKRGRVEMVPLADRADDSVQPEFLRAVYRQLVDSQLSSDHANRVKVQRFSQLTFMLLVFFRSALVPQCTSRGCSSA